MRPTRNIFKRLNAAHFLCGAVLFALASVSIAQDESAPITAASLESRAQRIFEAKEAIAKETAAWAEQKPLFENLIALREKEIAGIEEFTATAQERIDDVTQKRAEFTSEETDRKSWRANFEKKIVALETQLREVIPLLPAPVAAKANTSIARLDEETSLDQIPLQERFRDLLSILSAARDFDSKLTIESEIREIDGKRYQIDVLYLGLGHAWYVDESGKLAGFGVPSLSGWIWKEDKGIASQVRTAIEVNRREVPPAMVTLPFAAKTEPGASAE